MGSISKVLVMLVTIASFIGGFAFALFGFVTFSVGKSAIHEASGILLFICAILCFATYAIIMMLNGISSEIQLSRTMLGKENGKRQPDLPAESQSAIHQGVKTAPPNEMARKCPHCEKSILINETKCPYCNEIVPVDGSGNI